MSRASGFVFALLLFASPLAFGADAPVAGIVKHLQAPIPGALVFVYGVSDSTLNRARTAPDGSFNVEGIPVGVYDVIAYKAGFYPSLVRLWHQGNPAVSVLAIDLIPAAAGGAIRRTADIWTWRDRLPADVLREITIESAEPSHSAAAAGNLPLGRVVSGGLTSSTGFGVGTSRLTRTELNFFGVLPASLQYAFRGSYDSLGGASSGPLSQGTASDASMIVAGSPESGVALSYSGRTFVSATGGADPRLDRESATFNRKTDGGDQLAVSVARRVETGFDQATSILGQHLSGTSNTYELSANWSRTRDEANAGASIDVLRREVAEMPVPAGTSSVLEANLSASADHSIGDRVSVGGLIHSRTGGGGSAFSPGATVKLRLSPDSSLLVTAYRQVSGTPAETPIPGARTVSAAGWDSLAASAESAELAWDLAEGSTLQIKASSQDASEPLRILFNGDLLLDLGSLYLFDGNRMERLSGSASGRLFEVVDASLTAERGRVLGQVSPGTTRAFAVLQNEGDYYGGEASVTLRPTRTGISCGVRRIRQVIVTDTGHLENYSDMLRVSLGQDLTVLGFDPFGTAWKLVLAYETDRNPTAPESDSDESPATRKRLMGGVSISF
ncbi:MAG: carboxypeptidase-like regulatory domain-containing protein [Thermoanaerobaculia bacterium]